MKVIAINGSAKRQKGVTYDIYSRFIKGMEVAGATVNSIDLIDRNIQSCRACMDCWYTNPGKCFVHDEMDSIIKEMVHADLILLESPIYLHSASAQFKKFIERCMPINNRDFRIDDDGYFQHCTNYKIPPLIVISSCGLPGNHNFEAIDMFFEKLAGGWDTQIVGKIYLSEAFLLKMEIPELKVLKEDYYKRLIECAKEVVTTGHIEEKTQKHINTILLKSHIYVETAQVIDFM